MSLNYDLTRIANRLEKYPADAEGRTNSITHALIWACMAVDIGEITESNWAEFYARIQLVEKLHGSFSALIAPEDVKAHIGLHTNVSKESTAQFLKKIAGSFVESQQYVARKKVRTLEDAKQK